MIALILGGAPSWQEEARAAAELIGRRHMVVAANKAIEAFSGRLDGAATLHPDLLANWAARRQGNRDFRSFVPVPHETSPRAEVVAERWPGSSGLYAAQVALLEMGATGAILCGVPMDAAAGHFIDKGPWAGTDDYRQAFAAALPLLGGRLRSACGWTARLFGQPTPAWIDAIDITRPAGISAAPNARNDTMHHVRNGSGSTLSFWHNQPDGLRGRVHLDPGASGDFDVDPNAPEFARDGVKLTKPSAPVAKAATANKPAAKKAAPKKAAAPRPDPAPPAPPVSDEA